MIPHTLTFAFRAVSLLANGADNATADLVLCTPYVGDFRLVPVRKSPRPQTAKPLLDYELPAKSDHSPTQYDNRVERTSPRHMPGPHIPSL
jgi:hypothetical protein